MSYTTCLASLKSTLASVPGITAVVNGAPGSAQAWPLIYLAADRGERAEPGGRQMTVNVYYITATLCIPFQDNAIAEAGIAPYLNTIPDALDNHASVGGNVGYVIAWTADTRTIGEVACRVVDFTVKVTDKNTRTLTP